MNNLLRPRIWPSFSPRCRLYEPEAWRPRVSAPTTYRTGTETNTLRLPGGTPILFALAALRSVPTPSVRGPSFVVAASDSWNILVNSLVHGNR